MLLVRFNFCRLYKFFFLIFFSTGDPRSAVHVLHLIQELLPHVAALNLLEGVNPDEPVKPTTSNHYAWVESEHPYKPASVSNYRYSNFVVKVA